MSILDYNEANNRKCGVCGRTIPNCQENCRKCQEEIDIMKDNQRKTLEANNRR